MLLLALFDTSPKIAFRIISFVILLSLTKIFTRVNHKLVVFACDSHAQPVGNMRAVRDYLAALNLPIVIENSMRANLATRRTWNDKFRLLRHLATAQVLILDDFFPEAYVGRRPRGTSTIQLWHAAGAFKRVDFSRGLNDGAPKQSSVAHRGYTDVIVSSPDIVHDYEEAFRAGPGVVKPLGIPKTDPLFDRNFVAQNAKSVRSRYSIPAGNRVVLFAPTFRGKHQSDAHYEAKWIDWHDVASRPEFANTTFLVKHHPFLRDHANLVPSGLANVINVTDERDMTEFLCAADVLVTDYSSSIFEFALLNRPIVFYCPDLDAYINDRGFYYPLEDYLCGPVAHDQGELVRVLSDERPSIDKVVNLRHRFMDACDGNSTKRVVDELILPALDLS